MRKTFEYLGGARAFESRLTLQDNHGFSRASSLETGFSAAFLGLTWAAAPS